MPLAGGRLTDDLARNRVTNQNAKPLLVGQLARQAGVKSDTVRFYERAGLLPRPERTAAGYRTYPPEVGNRLRFIRQAQALGLSLDEIKRVLRMRDSGKLPCDFVIELAQRRLREVERELAGLEGVRDALRRYVRHWKRTANPDACAAVQFCNLIEEIELKLAPNAESQVRRGRLKRKK